MTTDITFEALANRLAKMAKGEKRQFVALAGAPGAGKSHVADTLFDTIEDQAPGSAAVLPMDGYHFDDILLEARGDRPRKGAPHTFDVNGFAAMLDRLALDDGQTVVVPVFDRDIEIARAGAREIPPEARLIVVEGNYLLLDQPDWAVLADRFDLTVFIDVPEAVLRERLAKRWVALDPVAKGEKLDGNDFPNMELVINHSRPADFRLPNAS